MNKEKKLFFIQTFGCQMNVHDSARAAGFLTAAGWEQTAQASEADLIFFNTCAVREKAESKLYGALGRVRDARKRGGRQSTGLVAVGGCVAQMQGTSLTDNGLPVDILIGPRSLHRLPELLEAGAHSGPRVALDAIGQSAFDVAEPPPMISASVRGLVTVMEGCNQVCSFCVVPRTRGTEICKPLDAVVGEARGWSDSGTGEVLLLGQTVNAYRWGERDFAGLLGAVAAVDGLRRLRFATSHPRHMTDPLIEAFGTLPNLCPHLHLPVQSGSDRVLRAMRRGYTRAEYSDTISAVRRRSPGVAIWSDIIVGYPGESDHDYAETVELVRTTRFEGLFTFTYSPRPGTVAFQSADDVPPEVKQERLAHLNGLQQSIQRTLNEARVGCIESVLLDGVGRDGQLEGRTAHNRVIHCPGSPTLVGRIVGVEVVSAGPNSLIGRIVGEW